METGVSPSPVTIERTPDALVVTMPVPRVGCTMAFLGVWLTGWAFGEVAAIGALVQLLETPSAGLAFIIVWLLAWTVAGASAAASLAVMLNGLEIVTLAPDGLRRRIEAFGVGRTRTYEPTRVEDLRAVSASRGGGGFVAFDYGSRTVRFGSGLTAEDADRIVAALLEYGAPKP
jgi:hypothetical protein